MENNALTKMTRPPLERIIKIHEAIQGGKFPNCRTMGEENSVDPDTIWRDIEFMRDFWGAPIDYNRRMHGYFYSGPVNDFLHLLSISEQELFGVAIIERTVQQYEGTSCYQPLRMLFDKIKQFLSPSKKYALKNLHNTIVSRSSAMETTHYEKFRVVSEAIERRRVLKYRYRNHNSTEITDRLIHAYGMVCVDQRWYMVGKDVSPHKTQFKVQSYVISRMDDLIITKEKFTVPKDFNLDDFLANCFRIMGGDGNYKVVIEFDSWGTDVICDRRWHSTQVFEPLPGGRSRITMQLNSLEEIEGWVLSHSTHATVIEPQELCDRLERASGELNERYRKRRLEREQGGSFGETEEGR